MQRYKTISFQQTYDALLAAARDTSSELFYDGKSHRGAAHCAAFWDGYLGLSKTANVVPETLIAVCFAAWEQVAKTNPGIRARVPYGFLV